MNLARPLIGTAWVRTNIGKAVINRREIVNEVDLNAMPLGRDWFDIPMKQAGDNCFQATLPLCDIGHFEGKCFFLPQGKREPVWPEGPNVQLNVAPADTCCGNIIYNAFVRQFGPNKRGQFNDPSRKPRIEALDRAGYTVIPPSGTFRDLIAELDFIIGRLGCRIIQMLPIHPTPTTYARMGRFGSPYAALSFTEVDPALAEFDPKATPLDQFIELVDAVHGRNAKIFIDIAINHTGWAASIHETHPEWLARNHGGEIEVPGAWGVHWADLTRLDYTHRDLWQYMATIFTKWCRRGVDGFRCDAGYMIPVPAWTYIIASVREQFPDTVFVLEGLGGKVSVTRELLNRAGFNWAYSELFQNYHRDAIERYLPEAIDISVRDGIAVHFAETHDNNRLASQSTIYARMRTALCALLSHQGAFGFANGVEWFATEKINVHGAASLNWEAENNQVFDICRMAALLKHHPVFHDGTTMKMIRKSDGNHIVMMRHHRSSGKRLLILANLDTESETEGAWEAGDAGMEGDRFTDLLTGLPVDVKKVGSLSIVRLDRGQVLCLSPDGEDLPDFSEDSPPDFTVPARIVKQLLCAKALEVIQFYRDAGDISDVDPDQAAIKLQCDPIEFCRRCNPNGDESRVITWHWPRDVKREVMVPPGHFLMIRSRAPFHARIERGDRVLATEEGVAGADGTFFALFPPRLSKSRHLSCTLHLSVFLMEACRHANAPLLYLAPWNRVRLRTVFNRSHVLERPLLLLNVNGRGGMLRAHADWGNLTSRYDALLAGNPNPHFPDNRRIMFTRCRVWLLYQGYSQEMTVHCLKAFSRDGDSNGLWDFQLPSGQGQHVRMTVGMEMVPGENSLRIMFYRHAAKGRASLLSDEKPVGLIIRPDIEDRNFHDTTKAYTGPESQFPECVAPAPDGFTFSPDASRKLTITLHGGTFTREPEWHYMVHRSLDAERGLDPASDLFSPGYFSALLSGKQGLGLTARMNDATEESSLPPETGFGHSVKRGCLKKVSERQLPHALASVLTDFVVKRGELKTVIAGYPWFLDWGRDSLIVVRGLIAAGRADEARDILKQFGRFEKKGTIPNMIQGRDAGNRDTSDGPLWLIAACRDLVRAEGDGKFLEERCGDRSFRQILISIGQAYLRGTPNGIRMDPESGLIYSPAHFTWMDTNYPAGTPREGYPVEIQALWLSALSFLARIDTTASAQDWATLSERVRQALYDLFWMEDTGYLSDCLHAPPGVPAGKADGDDLLRPNQLFAVTMGAVTDRGRCRKILAACEELLVPGAIRSLADRPVSRPLEVRHHGQLLNDPHHPYQGKYQGDEDTRRKPAYHNGTAWTWPFPVFCEAWAKTYGQPGKETALNWLGSATRVINWGCVGHLPEILDGDHPHHQRGCDAQAWGASELLRVWMKLTKEG